MIEREATVWIASEELGYILSPQNPAAARLQRAPRPGCRPSYYEVTVDLQGELHGPAAHLADGHHGHDGDRRCRRSRSSARDANAPEGD
ncbi:MAG: hypothetical protein U0599_28530 [Vicinamibacteria bacterium]